MLFVVLDADAHPCQAVEAAAVPPQRFTPDSRGLEVQFREMLPHPEQERPPVRGARVVPGQAGENGMGAAAFSSEGPWTSPGAANNGTVGDNVRSAGIGGTHASDPAASTRRWQSPLRGKRLGAARSMGDAGRPPRPMARLGGLT